MRKNTSSKKSKKKNYKKVKFNPETVMSKKKFSVLHYTSLKFRKKYIEDRMKEIKSLPDYNRIDRILNTEHDGSERNPCSLPENRNRTAPFWNTHLYLVQQIKKCILSNDWPCLTQCLLSLKDASKYYQKFLLKACIINFMVNPASVDNHLFEDFLQQFFSLHTESDRLKYVQKHFVLPRS